MFIYFYLKYCIHDLTASKYAPYSLFRDLLFSALSPHPSDLRRLPSPSYNSSLHLLYDVSTSSLLTSEHTFYPANIHIFSNIASYPPYFFTKNPIFFLSHVENPNKLRIFAL